MKVLDVKGLDTDIEQAVKDIHAIQAQITELQKAVRGVTLLEDSFKGKAGEAIRSFYNDVHQPFLIYMYQFLTQFEQTLKQTKQAVQAFENNPNGFIRQDFLQNEVAQGLERVKEVTTSLTDGANQVIRSVQDIVSLPLLDPEELIYQVQRGKRKAHETIEQLYALDNSQTGSLKELNLKMQTMRNYVADMGGKFQGGATSITGYHRSVLQSSDAYTVVSEKVSPIQTAMKKMDQLYSYAAPYTTMLAPQDLFPLTYRHHEVSKKPVKFDNIKETDMYQENQLTDLETAAIQEYLRNIDVNEENKAYSVDNVSKPDYGPITFEDRRKVMGGNSKLAGSPDGLAGPAVAVTNFFTEDIATVISANASIGERMLAAAFILPTPVKFMKPMDDVMGGMVGKRIDNGVNFGKYSTSIDDKVKVTEKVNLPDWISESFAESNYRTVITEEKITFYRTFGSGAKANGSFVTTSPAGNRINAKINTALVPDWKNTREYEALIEVPKGQILNIGRVEKQYTKTGALLEGDGDQILLPQGWPSEWIKEIGKVPSR